MRVLWRALYATAFCLSCSIEPAITTPTTYADFLKLSGQIVCEAGLRCCGSLCRPTTDAEFFQQRARMLTYLNAGLFAYDRQAAADCLVARQQRYTSCDAAIPELPSLAVCSRVLSPQAPVGSVCESGVNPCGPGSACVNVSCTLRRLSNEFCPTTSTPECRNDQDSCCMACTGLCAAMIPIGGTCLPASPSTQCQTGSFCLGTTAKCTAYAMSGQACSAALPCVPNAGLSCLPGSQICGPPQPDGATCTDGSQCMSTYCLLPNYPALTQGTCQTHPSPMTVRAQLCPSLN